MPDPLPPAIERGSPLIGALSEADRLVGRLAGEGGRLPNPRLLIRPFVRREAVLSSEIEDTQVTVPWRSNTGSSGSRTAEGTGGGGGFGGRARLVKARRLTVE
ncbi:MAG TPA: Fic/DOC family N-terminal domain-containing protein [Methylomirabilota bacterium]